MQTSQEKQPSLNKTLSEINLIEIEREINVPVDQLFGAFANAEAIEAWWWPEGIYSDNTEFDFVVGGRYFINMKGHDNCLGGMTGRFEEIVPGKRIVMTDLFANEDGQPISPEEANIPGVWPDFIIDTFEFESLSGNKSRVKLSQQGVPPEAHKECTKSWNQMFDKLERHLKTNLS